MEIAEEGAESTLVTGGALFGIKFIGGNAEHVVALDADAMEIRRFF